MSDTVIRVESLGKRYLIDHHQQESYRSLRDVLANTAKDITQRFNPKSKIKNQKSEEFWALKDVSFEVNRGDIVGIIGRNGAGKSTLLKILSRITEPTEGRISLKGRVSSLLEVGTGFHPELTGRENIYLNGAILGMSKVEIRRKFDEIVAFAEIEKFLDTPVKRYSSGMYVRLAFAVAAHLEPEVLIVDEVLAVGDAQFQKKCLGKMENVASEGRTILFVSHNMAAIRALCSRSLLMRNGRLLLDSDISTAIESYLAEDGGADSSIEWRKKTAPQSPEICFKKAYLIDQKDTKISLIDCKQSFSIILEYEVLKPLAGLRTGISVQNIEGIIMCGSNTPDIHPETITEPGIYASRCTFPGNVFNTGRYSIAFGADIAPYTNLSVHTPHCLSFMVEDTHGHGIKREKLPGVMRPDLRWESLTLSKKLSTPS
jgi:lipopolysaccharide transport system ATP-binding protein